MDETRQASWTLYARGAGATSSRDIPSSIRSFVDGGVMHRSVSIPFRQLPTIADNLQRSTECYLPFQRVAAVLYQPVAGGSH